MTTLTNTPMTPAQAEEMKKRFRERVTRHAWPAKKDLVTVIMPAQGDLPEEPVELEVRQPTHAQRTRILQAANMLSDDPSKRDLSKLMVYSAAECSYFPGTNVQVIDSMDIPGILLQPAGGWVDQLGKVATQLMNVDAVAAAKKSETTPSSNSSV